MNIPAGYRALNAGETVLESDKWTWGRDDIEDVSGGNVGHEVTAGELRFDHGFIRPIQNATTGWIRFKDRMPERTGGKVLLVWECGTTEIVNRDYPFKGTLAVAWMPLPPVPTPPKPEIKAGEHKVTFRKDGSLKVGCTEVSSELFEKIAARRKEEMA